MPNRPRLAFSHTAQLAQAGCGDAPEGGPPSAPRDGPPTSIRQVMGRLAKGPGSLTPILGDELKLDPPAWDLIDEQSHEFVALAAAMAGMKPPKGSAESWAAQTKLYAEMAAELDKAAHAQDKDAALAAHGRLKGSCMACHAEHKGSRGMGPGPGGPPPG